MSQQTKTVPEEKTPASSPDSFKSGLIRSAKFLVFSCTAGVIEMASFTLLNEICGFSYWPAYLIALILSVLYNFTVNRRYTFQSANNVPVAMLKVALYYCVFTPVTTVGGNYFTGTLHVNEYLVLAVTMVLNFITEFLFCRYVVYRGQMDNNSVAQKKALKKELCPDTENQ